MMAEPSQCQVLSALLGVDKVALPGSAAYNSSLLSYFDLTQSTTTHPHCFVAPQTCEDVSLTVETLTSSTSRKSTGFAIQFGGHMWFPGASNINGGVTIDIRGLNTITQSSNQSTVSVGPGATWDAVYAELDLLEVSVTGGRIAGVGVGGSTIGGGISYLGPRAGWTCTTTSACHVVLADGSIVEANATQNFDLFMAFVAAPTTSAS